MQNNTAKHKSDKKAAATLNKTYSTFFTYCSL